MRLLASCTKGKASHLISTCAWPWAGASAVPTAAVPVMPPCGEGRGFLALSAEHLVGAQGCSLVPLHAACVPSSPASPPIFAVSLFLMYPSVERASELLHA